MNKDQILLSLVLKEVEVPASLEKFDNRLLVQKTVYLMQQAGVELGYPYTWYVRGPYSSRLAEDLYNLVGMPPENSEELGKYVLGEKTRALIGKIKDLFGSGMDLETRAKYMELMASVLFLIKTGQAKPNEDQKLSEILKSNGKQFEPSDAQQAVASLKRHGYSF